jgi:hypothetical protein
MSRWFLSVVLGVFLTRLACTEPKGDMPATRYHGPYRLSSFVVAVVVENRYSVGYIFPSNKVLASRRLSGTHRASLDIVVGHSIGRRVC